jgi:hypothetical protein
MSARASALRRIITAVNAAGKSFVAHDGPPDPALEFATGTGLYEIWTDAGGELDRQSTANFDTGPVHLTPPPGGVKLRWTILAPEAPGTVRADSVKFYDKAFASIGAHGDRPDTTRHPGMHLTQTIDFVIIVEGKVRLILDEGDRLLGPGDVVVQRGTNHAWVCESETPAVFVAVLIDKTFAT